LLSLFAFLAPTLILHTLFTMIENLSTAATLYLAPTLSLTSFLLSLFAFLAPTLILHTQVALLTVSPSSALTSPNQPPKGSLDGPSIHFGVLGSCAQKTHSAPINCTTTQFSTTYNTAVLPANSNPDVLTALPYSASLAVLIALVLLTLFFILFALITMRSRLGRFGTVLSKPVVSRASAWLGLFGFLIGMTVYLVLRLWFGKMALDFNQAITKQGTNGPQLVATVGNAFTMAWVAHAFAAIPLVCAMTKLHVTAAGDKA